MEINTEAPVITRDEIVISAPISKVWEIQTGIGSWPEWQDEIDEAEGPGELKEGSVFRWKTAGLDITSTIAEVVPPRRIVWGGPAQGITAVHVWDLREQEAAGVLVRTEESWEGKPVEADVEAMQGALDASLRAWLEALKSAAERSTAV